MRHVRKTQAETEKLSDKNNAVATKKQKKCRLFLIITDIFKLKQIFKPINSLFKPLEHILQLFSAAWTQSPVCMKPALFVINGKKRNHLDIQRIRQ